VGNGLAIAERRRLLTADDADGALTVLNELASHLFETDVDLVPVSSAFSAARMHLLSAYDAVYLELAKRCQLPLATLDQPLRAAASKAGVELFR
jgi:predicted nucleic acid-binding protein